MISFHKRRHGTLGRRLERPLGVLGEERFHLHIVLLRLERAGGVDQQSAGQDGVGRGAKDRALGGRHHREVGDPQPPPCIGMTTERAGAGAGRVDEDRVEGAERGRVACVAHDRRHMIEF